MRKLVWSIVVAFLLTGCGKNQQSSTDGNKSIESVAVKVSTVNESLIAETVKITGEIVPDYQIDVFPKANGIVVAEFVSLGKKVMKNQVLAEVKQDIPGMDYANVKIEATASGVITRDVIEIGGRVSVQAPVYQISQLHPIYLQANVLEMFLKEINVGERVEVAVDAFPDQKFTGIIKEISPLINPRSRTASVKIKIANSNGLLKPGMFSRADLTLGNYSGLVVPLDAIVKNGAEQYIYLIREGKAKRVKVETGRYLTDKIEVKGEIVAGEKVVIMGQNMITDGTLVNIVERN